MVSVTSDASYLTPAQAARIFGVSPKTVARWANHGRIPCLVTLGGHRRFRADVIAAVSVTMGMEDHGVAKDSS